MTYLTLEGDENDDVSKFRKHVRENGIDQEALDIIPHWLGFERDMIRHILEKPEDWLGAFRRLPNNLQLMTVHALQSVVFNKTIKARLEQNISLS